MMKSTYTAVAALFLSMVGTASMAQTHPDPACKIEGPSIVETLAYINSSLAKSIPADLMKEQVYALQDSFQVTVTNTDPDHGALGAVYDGYYAAVNDLECGASLPGFNKLDGVYMLSIDCKGGKSCVSQGAMSRPAISHGDMFVLRLNMDSDHQERLKNAISHLIALLQKQYNETHTETDPFAK